LQFRFDGFNVVFGSTLDALRDLLLEQAIKSIAIAPDRVSQLNFSKKCTRKGVKINTIANFTPQRV
jgi:hypothetical protein